MLVFDLIKLFCFFTIAFKSVFIRVIRGKKIVFTSFSMVAE